MFTRKLVSMLLYLVVGPKLGAIQTVSPVAGHQPIDNQYKPDTVQKHPLGYVLEFYDTFFGWQRAVYAKSAAAQVVGEVVKLSWATASAASVTPTVTATAADTSIAQGKPVAVAKQAFSAADQFGWYIISGIAPVASDSALAADAAAFVHAAGRLGATGVGKQVVGLNVLKTSTATVTKANSIVDKGTYNIRVTNTDGLFIGMPITGTGVGSSAKITNISTDNVITVDVVSTASGTVTITGTYNDGTIYWNTCLLANPASIV